MQKMLDSGFIQAVKMVVDQIGFNADPKVRATQEIAVATAPIDSPLGVIEPGQVAGRKFHWEALVDGEPVVRVTVNWLMGEENLDPAWTLGTADSATRWRSVAIRTSRHRQGVSTPKSGEWGRSMALSARPRTA